MTTLFESTGIYEGLSANEARYLRRWENEVLPMVVEFQHSLMEATATKDQVIDMFNRIEKSAKEGGFMNRSGVGKALDIIKLPSTLMDKIGEVMSDYEAVKWSDAKFQKLKEKIRADLGNDHKAVKMVDWYGKFAQSTKGKLSAGAVIGLLTVAATVAGGPMGGAVVAGVLRFGNELLKGEKLSTAAGRTIKTASLAFLAGWSVKQFLGLFANTVVDVAKIPGYQGLQKVTMVSEMNGRTLFSLDAYMPNSTAQKAQKLFNLAHEAAVNGEAQKAARAFGAMRRIFDDPQWTEVMNTTLANNDKLLQTATKSAEKARQIIADISGAVEGAVAAGTTKDKKPTTESRQLNEADVKSILGNIGKWANNLTNKITADKLMKDWEAEGSPLDSEDLAKFLTKHGLDKSIVYSTLGVEEPKAEPAAAESPESFDTGDAALDAKLSELMASKGKDAVVKALQAYKARLMAANDPYEKFKGELRKLAGLPGAKPIPGDKAAKFKAEVASDIAKMAQGDKDSGAFAANKIMQYAKAGYNVTDQINKWLANAKIGEKGKSAKPEAAPAPEATADTSTATDAAAKKAEFQKRAAAAKAGKAKPVREAEEHGFLSAIDYRDLTAILKEHGFDWKDLGIRVSLDESVKDGLFISRTVA